MSGTAGLPVSELHELMRSGDVSAVDIVTDHLERIEKHNDELRAFLLVNPEARNDAEEIDARLHAGEEYGPLAGVPVAIKDNICTMGMATTCASELMRNFSPLTNATVVERLKKAGAVIVGKTNMDEFSMGSSTENSAFGGTRNPWDTDRVPGGSSGGSMVAVSSGMATLALGSETGGSVRQPAAFCGVVGLKPSYGRVSRAGLVAFGSSLDQIGPAAMTVADCARTLQVIAGNDAADSTSADLPVGRYVDACGDGVNGLRIGLPGEYLCEGLDPEIKGAVLATAVILSGAGAIIEEVSLPHTRYSIPAYYLIATAEASSNLARFDGVRYGQRHDDGDGLVPMYRATRGKGFGPEVKRRIMLGTYSLSAGYYEAFYGKALRVRTLLRRDFLELFEKGVDLVLTPVTPTPPFRRGEKSEDPLAMYLSDIYTATVNLAGLPAISVPAGLTGSNLPIGVQLIAPDFREDLLFRAATVIEETVGNLQPPLSS